jgi:hypothetical protein
MRNIVIEIRNKNVVLCWFRSRHPAAATGQHASKRLNCQVLGG